MAFEQKPGYGALFRNDRATSNAHPTHKGYVVAHRNIREGEKLDIAAWVKVGRDGGKFFSLKLSDPYQAGPQAAPQRDPREDDPNEEIPF